MLNDLDTHQVLVNNMEVQNQEGMKCFQCAGFLIDGCHCHVLECAVCNPEHYCPVCGELEYILMSTEEQRKDSKCFAKSLKKKSLKNRFSKYVYLNV